ncbi:tRNA uridine 5-carboxymethylaminomethyl modification enzyme MnmG [Phycisphaerales bacterium]|nr:tRNA uridine 5-carboxymethylaminomethyl modification enzyme MnmG [Phycisphaerales bacterium]
MAEHRYQVIVIGGGHAGVEAAWACANLLPGERTVALVTLDPSKIGVMSCNPAIGGLAKGQLVREIDALGGLMGLATDLTGIQFKVLNQSKGPAVHGPRAQCDKHAYAQAVQALIASRPEVEVIAGSVERLLVEGGRVRGVEIARGTRQAASTGGSPVATHVLSAAAVVLTTGTFMRGLMHCGEQKTRGGRFGEDASVGISGALRDLGFELGRLKTGTPPRLKRGTIDWDALEPAMGDDVPLPFSDLTGMDEPDIGPDSPALSLRRFPVLPQVDCRQTRTTAHAHEMIRANLHRAPMYSGQIESVGPRYCPSIEDKVVRFAERESHGVFLEPESLRDDWIYCNGISTSLPPDVQDVIVRSMPGCEHAHIYRYGYAVEYDMVRPHQIRATGMTKLVEGLFLAGQINGTSGYEEAAAQGIVAGINAARRVLARGEFVVGRDQAYIGVLMDDLVTKTPVEPYRMFTSRAEHRLSLRSDNAPERLTPLARDIGLLDSTRLGRVRWSLFERRRELASRLHEAIDRERSDGEPLSKLARSDKIEAADLRAMLAAAGCVPEHDDERFLDATIRTVHADRRYEAYLVRQRTEVKRQGEMEHRRIPDAIDFGDFKDMRAEARQALAKFRPSTFGQAGRLEGVTPADLTLLSVLVDRWGRDRRQLVK